MIARQILKHLQASPWAEGYPEAAASLQRFEPDIEGTINMTLHAWLQALCEKELMLEWQGTWMAIDYDGNEILSGDHLLTLLEKLACTA